MALARESQDNLLLGLAGDVMIGRLVDENFDRVPHDHIWGSTLPLLQATDLNLVNLEAALTTSAHKVLKVFNFKAKPDRVNALKMGSIHLVNLANNHCLDYAKEGLQETLATLDKGGILHAGAGTDLAQAKSPALMKVRGIQVGVIGCTDNEPTWEASTTTPGTFYIEINEEGLQTLLPVIERTRKAVDILIISLHWGPNMRERPPSHFRRFAHALIDAGADIIHGHSAHIFQGVEIYKHKLILYDTGDFIDDYYVDPLLRNDRSFFFVVEAGREKLQRLLLFPVCIRRFQANLAQGQDKSWAMERMRQLSAELGTKLEQTEDCLIARF